MKRIIIFLVFVYLLSILGIWVLLSKNTTINQHLLSEITIAKEELLKEQLAHSALKEKFASTRENIKFLSLALCPVLETTDKDALCVGNSSEWLSQTIEAGTLIADTDIKTKMEALIISLGEKKTPTAKQFYEALKPIEIRSLKILIENLE